MNVPLDRVKENAGSPNWARTVHRAVGFAAIVTAFVMLSLLATNADSAEAASTSVSAGFENAHVVDIGCCASGALEAPWNADWLSMTPSAGADYTVQARGVASDRVLADPGVIDV